MRLNIIATRVETMAIRLEAIPIRFEAIPIRLEAIATRATVALKVLCELVPISFGGGGNPRHQDQGGPPLCHSKPIPRGPEILD